MRLTLLAVALAGCIRPDLVTCPNGLQCSADQVCDEVHDRCVSPERLEVCADLADGTVCNASGDVGECLDGVCLDTICGDGLLAASELCDDGNTLAGDGCDPRCASTEECGNGVLDAAMGEDCDDANRIAGDGCDSRCRGEREEWTTYGIALQTAETFRRGHTAYDRIRKQSVAQADGFTWTWTGARWAVLSQEGPPAQTYEYAWRQLLWDSDRNTVLYIGASGGGAIDEVWSWNGTVWSELASQNPAPNLQFATAAYDRARHVAVLVGYGDSTEEELWAFDPATRSWTRLPSVTTTFFSNGSSMSYDEVRDVTVLLAPRLFTSSFDTWEWNGSQWTAFPSQSIANNPSTTMYDPVVGSVIAIGPAGSAKWTGTSWQALPGAGFPIATSEIDLWFDIDRQKRVGVGTGSKTYEYDNAWTLIAQPQGIANFVGFAGMRYSYDPLTHSVLQLGCGMYLGTTAGTDFWTVSDEGVWRQLPLAPINSQTYPYPGAMVFDPRRRGHVMVFPNKATMVFKDELWTELAPAGSAPSPGFSSMTYDPVRGAVVALGTGGTWMLPSTGSTWTNLATTGPSNQHGSLGYDAKSNVIVFADNSAGTQVFDGTAWKASLSAGRGFALVTNDRRGTAEMVRGGHVGWEHGDGAWLERQLVPHAIDGFAMYAPETGSLLIIGVVGKSRVMMKRRVVGVSPIDGCRGGDDDGDQMIDCADVDCWWSCPAPCPPHSSCP